jgi:hypothetical protein
VVEVHLAGVEELLLERVLDVGHVRCVGPELVGVAAHQQPPASVSSATVKRSCPTVSGPS